MKEWNLKNGLKIVRVLSGRSNSFLITNGAKNILVDTGPGYLWKTLDRNISKLGLTSLDYLILTHSHFDHAANAHLISEKYNPVVIIHSSEKGCLESGTNIIPVGTNPVTMILGKVIAGRIVKYSSYNPCSAGLTFDEQFDLKQTGINANVIHTPGHTPGSASIIVGDKIALVGDTMIGVFRNSVFPPWANDVPALLESWRKLLQTGCSLFLPSHGNENNMHLVKKDYIKRINKQFDKSLTHL